MHPVFRVGLTPDLLSATGSTSLSDIGLGRLDQVPDLDYQFLPEGITELSREHIHGYHALVMLGGRVSSSSLEGADNLTVLARYGVGYDTIDIDACTRNGIAVTITPDGVRRPMATAIMTLVLALGSQLIPKDRLTRRGDWHEKRNYMGRGLTGRVLASIGYGNIARELFTLAEPFGMRHIAHDPFVAPEVAPAVELMDLETLFRTADYLIVNCALTPGTHHWVNAERLSLMKRTAFLINAAGGPIVDLVALTEALTGGQIAGAALDVFEHEPVDVDDPLLALDNLIVTPHALGWTDEWMRLTGDSVSAGIVAVAAGREPLHVVNRSVLDTALFRRKLSRHAIGRPA
ncbi:MAG: D-3-phosphoglycerate dehydrogenase [uncultured Chloroflexia bacterium]|uniref:D-3-phosphoglycerate dehydrogenase n=1 Tax=uncultured Chloroflexia bacterium TaxID=1672391 RepID=A0A6J4MZS3_9CHLR|nr:MAG: D-3-phosphoglycerate dehydrogenase [uncultured Chloroflexia bacterium]